MVIVSGGVEGGASRGSGVSGGVVIIIIRRACMGVVGVFGLIDVSSEITMEAVGRDSGGPLVQLRTRLLRESSRVPVKKGRIPFMILARTVLSSDSSW